MRARNIKPGFFDNEELAEIDMAGRLLFVGLWMMADREGRLEERTKRIKAKLFPYDSINVEIFLKKLHEKRFIIRYSLNGLNYIQIRNFLKHQTPHIKEAASTIPAPDENQTSTRQESCEHPLNPESPFLNPESLSTSTPSPGKPGETEFEKFWESYPKKVGRLEAKRAWNKNKHPGIEKILEAIALQRASPQWNRDGGQFIPNPTTWLNQGRWDDVPENLVARAPTAKCHKPAGREDDKLWTGPVPEDFKKAFEKIGEIK